MLKLVFFGHLSPFVSKVGPATPPETAGTNLNKINFVLSIHLLWSFTYLYYGQLLIYFFVSYF